MDDGMGPVDDWNESDEPTQPLPVVRPSGTRMPQSDRRRAEMPPLPPAAPRWPPYQGEAGGPALDQEWPGTRTRRYSRIERALQAARERQLSLGCGAVAAIVLLGALVLAALGGNFAGLGGSPFVPRPTIQAAPRPTTTPLPTPTATPSPTPTPSPLPTATPLPSPTATPFPSPSPTPLPSPTVVPSPTPPPIPSPSSVPSEIPGPTPPPDLTPASSPIPTGFHNSRLVA